jgi:hypothetical protein
MGDDVEQEPARQTDKQTYLMLMWQIKENAMLCLAALNVSQSYHLKYSLSSLFYILILYVITPLPPSSS